MHQMGIIMNNFKLLTQHVSNNDKLGSTPVLLLGDRPGFWLGLTGADRTIDDGLCEIFVSSIASYPERWRDGPCETLATCR